MLYRVMFYHTEDKEPKVLAYNLLEKSAIEHLRLAAKKHGVKFTRKMRRIERKYATFGVAYYIEEQ